MESFTANVFVQEARTIEELAILKVERARVVQYYLHMQQVCARAAEQRTAARSQLEHAVQAQLDAGSPSVVARQMQQQVSQITQLRAETALLDRQAELFGGAAAQAAQQFATL